MKILFPCILILIGIFGCSEKTTRTSDTKFQSAGIELSYNISKPDSISSEHHAVHSGSDTVSGKNSSNGLQVYRFIVSFYSIGAGIEPKQLEKFEHFLQRYRQKTSKTIRAEKTRWGREGETDFCIELSEFSPADQRMFIRDAKEELKTAGRVNYSENSPCRQQHR